MLHMIRIFLEHNEAFQDRRQRNVLVRGELCALTVRQQHRCGVCLKTCDCLGLACLANHINSLLKFNSFQLQLIS